MAQIITTKSTRVIYTPISSIRLYNEPDFERKLLRYSKEIFSEYYIMKCKYGLTSDSVSGKFEPDLILVSKSFKKWVLIEVELCKSPTSHTINQIKCFSNPKYDSLKLFEYLKSQDKSLESKKSEIIYMLNNVEPDFIVVLDDYSDKIFEKYRNVIPNLKICVLEVYKTNSHPYEAFRFGGDYPYELSNSSKLKWVDNQHYEILKKDFADILPTTIDLTFDMDPFKANIFKTKSGRRKYYLKMHEHNIPEDHYLQIGVTINGDYVIQRL